MTDPNLAAWVINCQPHDIPILVGTRLLKPLGNPAANGIKFLATADLLEAVIDRAWLVKMTNAINQHWQRNNASKKPHQPNALQSGHGLPVGHSSTSLG